MWCGLRQLLCHFYYHKWPALRRMGDHISALFLALSSLDIYRMPPSGMLFRVALVRTDISEERSSSVIEGTTNVAPPLSRGLLMSLALTSNRRTLRSNTMWEYIISQYFFTAVFRFRFSVASYWYNCSYIYDFFYPDDRGDNFLTSLLARDGRHHIPEYGTLQSTLRA
jgi:hypothetical protein